MGYWPFKTKTERMILQDVFLMHRCLESDTFVLKNDTFVVREQIQVSHLSPQALKTILRKFLYSATMVY